MASNFLKLVERVLLPNLELLKKDIEQMRQINNKLGNEISELHQADLQIFQEIAGLKARMNGFEREITLKLENRYLKDILRKLG